MAPVIWGLDLKEMQWGKFKSSYMWDREYHLRRTKFIIYQCALIFCVLSESLGTAVLSDYIDGQRRIQHLHPHVYVGNNDYVGAASYNIFAGVFVAFIFGAAFFFDLFWPTRKENRGVRLAWKTCGVLAVVFHLASALTLTIITATRQSYLTNVGDRVEQRRIWAEGYKKHRQAPLDYKHNGRAVAAVVFVWLGCVSVFFSCILLFLSIDNVEHGPGPLSAHARHQNTDLSTSIDTTDLEKQDHPSSAPPMHNPSHESTDDTVVSAAQAATRFHTPSSSRGGGVH